MLPEQLAPRKLPPHRLTVKVCPALAVTPHTGWFTPSLKVAATLYSAHWNWIDVGASVARGVGEMVGAVVGMEEGTGVGFCSKYVGADVGTAVGGNGMMLTPRACGAAMATVPLHVPLLVQPSRMVKT